MTDSRRLPAIAIGMAILAVVLAVVAVIVTATRGGDAPTEIAKPAVPAPPVAKKIAALDVAELERDGVEPVSEAGAVIGVKVTDPGLRGALGLEAADVITSISGRAIRRQFDVYDVLVGATMMNATALFVEVQRDGAAVLVRWDLDGDLREARRNRPNRRPPSVRPAKDPLLDSIKQIDDHHFTLPRATLEQLASDPTLYAQGARLLPGGRDDGVRLFLVRPNSALWVLGLRSADTIRALTGVEIDDAQELRTAFEQVKASPIIRIEITRRNVPEVIEITQTP